MQDMRKKLELSGRTFNYYSLNALAEELGIDLNNLPVLITRNYGKRPAVRTASHH